MTRRESEYRLLLAESLRRRAVGEVRSPHDEDEIDAQLERMWIDLSDAEQDRISADVETIVSAGVGPLDEYRFFAATLRDEPKVQVTFVKVPVAVA